jgi:hypothetical protein
MKIASIVCLQGSRRRSRSAMNIGYLPYCSENGFDDAKALDEIIGFRADLMRRVVFVPFFNCNEAWPNMLRVTSETASL